MRFGNKQLDLSRPRIMGVCNITPDSFYEGSRFSSGSESALNELLAVVDKMIQNGADFIDIGGESTRPGAVAVSEQEELDRVIPVVDALAKRFDAVISIDTSTPAIMHAAVESGAGLINDVRALTRDGALATAAALAQEHDAAICLMHMQGTPESMQDSPSYQDLLSEVNTFFEKRVAACTSVGISQNQLILDPGIGFGKTDEHNLSLLANLKDLGGQKFAKLIGVSRKSLFGRLLGREPEDRLAGSLGLGLKAVANGAAILRVHDVAETADALKMFNMVDTFRH